MTNELSNVIVSLQPRVNALILSSNVTLMVLIMDPRTLSSCSYETYGYWIIIMQVVIWGIFLIGRS